MASCPPHRNQRSSECPISSTPVTAGGAGLPTSRLRNDTAPYHRVAVRANDSWKDASLVRSCGRVESNDGWEANTTSEVCRRLVTVQLNECLAGIHATERRETLSPTLVHSLTPLSATTRPDLLLHPVAILFHADSNFGIVNQVRCTIQYIPLITYDNTRCTPIRSTRVSKPSHLSHLCHMYTGLLPRQLACRLTTPYSPPD